MEFGDQWVSGRCLAGRSALAEIVLFLSYTVVERSLLNFWLQCISLVAIVPTTSGNAAPVKWILLQKIKLLMAENVGTVDGLFATAGSCTWRHHSSCVRKVASLFIASAMLWRQICWLQYQIFSIKGTFCENYQNMYACFSRSVYWCVLSNSSIVTSWHPSVICLLFYNARIMQYVCTARCDQFNGRTLFRWND